MCKLLKMRVLLISLLFLIFCNLCVGTIANAQSYPSDLLIPLRIPLIVTGNFGELRSNHFHSGMDFSTNNKENIPIYAPADGYVTRIKVSVFGYGKALYIKHNNGFTSVYAHLNAYSDTIQKYVKAHQYQNKSYEVELFPTLQEFEIKKGELIGYSGNTGGSQRPHLHFEYRDTKSEDIINPLFFGVNTHFEDTQSPIVNELMVYPIGGSSVVNGLQKPFVLQLKKTDTSKYLSEVLYVDGKIGFGIDAYDVCDGSNGKNGLFSIQQQVNGVTNFYVEFDRFSFADTRLINQYIDYYTLKTTKKTFQKLFITQVNKLPLIKTLKNQGVIEVQENTSCSVSITLADYFGNTTQITIPIEYKKEQLVDENQNTGKFIDFQKDYIFQENRCYVEWSPYTFLEDFYIDLQYLDDGIVLHRDIVPVYKDIDLRINVENLPIDKEKAFIGLKIGERIQFFKTWKSSNEFRIKTKTLGAYQVFEDLEGPSIKAETLLGEKKLSVKDEIVFEIEDNLSGIATFDAYINDQWILMEYDYKTKKVRHQLQDGIATFGENEIKIVVTDAVGNKSVLENKFILE